MGSRPWGFESPLAHIVFSDSYRGRRRGLKWTLPVLITVFALAFIVSGGLRSETRAVVAYLDAAAMVAQDQLAQASSFQRLLLRDLDNIERDRLLRLLSAMQESLSLAEEDMAEVELPRSATRAGTALSLALETWQDALGRFQEAALGVVDEPGDPAHRTALEDALVRLRVGDTLYGSFVLAAEEMRSDLDVEIGAFPEVRYMPPPSSLTSSERVTLRLQAANGLTLRRRIFLGQVRFEPPESGGDRNGARVIPNTPTVDVLVAVTNEGNVTESDAVLLVRLQRGSRILDSRVEELEAMGPGTSTTVTFEDFEVEPTFRYALLVSLTTRAPQEDLEGTRVELDFVVNEPT